MKKIVIMNLLSIMLVAFVGASFGDTTGNTTTNTSIGNTLNTKTNTSTGNTLNTTTNTSTSNTLSSAMSAVSNFISSYLFSAAKPTPAPPLSPPAPVVTPAFPLPEGMETAPPLLSAGITSAISSVMKPMITPALMEMITSKEEVKTPAPSAPVQMASFQPVGPPSSITASSSSISNPARVVTTSASVAQPTSQAVVMKSLKPQAFTGNFDITSRYVFRGISQSANTLAFQGGLTYTFLTTGLYLNVWGSNVDFLSRQGQQASVKVDTVAGIKNNIGKYFTYDLSMVRYNFPKASGANYNEFVSVLSYRILILTLGYSSNAFNAHANGLYYNGGFSIPIPEKYTFQYTNVSLIGNYGHYNLSKEVGLRSYSDFMLGIKKVIHQYTLILQWTGTNGEAKLKGLDANRLVGTVAVSF